MDETWKVKSMEEENVKFQGEFGDTPIGDKDKSGLTAKPVTILDYEEKEVRDAKGKAIGTKLVLICQHPDTDKTVDISQLKYLNNLKVVKTGLWVNRDLDGKIPYNSAVANLLRFTKKAIVRELVNTTIETVLDDNGYLVIKAY